MATPLKQTEGWRGGDTNIARLCGMWDRFCCCLSTRSCVRACVHLCVVCVYAVSCATFVLERLRQRTRVCLCECMCIWCVCSCVHACGVCVCLCMLCVCLWAAGCLAHAHWPTWVTCATGTRLMYEINTQILKCNTFSIIAFSFSWFCKSPVQLVI